MSGLCIGFDGCPRWPPAWPREARGGRPAAGWAPFVLARIRVWVLRAACLAAREPEEAALPLGGRPGSWPDMCTLCHADP